MHRTARRIIAIVAGALLLVGCLILMLFRTADTPALAPTSAPCYVQGATYFDELDRILTVWGDQHSLANSTTRGQLSAVVSDLQETRRSMKDLEPPSCAQEAHSACIAYMDAYLDAIMSFMRGQSDGLVSRKFQAAKSLQHEFVDALGAAADGRFAQ